MTKRYLLSLAWLALARLPSTAIAQPVGPEFQVNTYTTYAQRDCSVASDATGNFVVVWRGFFDDSGRDVLGQRYDSAGKRLGGEFRVNTHTGSDQYAPSIASAAGGNFVVVWASYAQGGLTTGGLSLRAATGVFGQRYDSGGNSLGGEFRVNTYTTNGQNVPSIASDATGNFVVVWESIGQEPRSFGVFGQRYNAAGNRLGGEFQVNTYTAGPQRSPSVASDPTGNFVVVWQSRGDISGQRYDSGGSPLGGEFRVNTSPFAGNYAIASVAVDPTGTFLVVWDDDPSGDILGQRYDGDGNPLGEEFRLNTYRTGAQLNPSVAVNANGNFIVVWQSFGEDRDQDGIFARRYDSGGNPLGDAFQVNTYTPNGQNAPSVAANTNGDFVVAWQSEQDAGGGNNGTYGIFGQRFKGLADPVECADLRAVRTRCHNGNLQVGFALADDSHDGETLTLRVNGKDRVLPIEGNRAEASGPGQGLNTLLLVAPRDCAEEKTVQCP